MILEKLDRLELSQGFGLYMASLGGGGESSSLVLHCNAFSEKAETFRSLEVMTTKMVRGQRRSLDKGA